MTENSATLSEFEMRFDGSTIKHLGVQMYSSLPPVIGELVSNAWDAGARIVKITVPDQAISEQDIIVVEDDGSGMTDREIQEKFLVVGRDRRREENDEKVKVGHHERPVMGRKGIGKFSGFGIAREIEIETIKNGFASRFVMSYKDLEEKSKTGKITFPKLSGTGFFNAGTRVTLRDIQKFRKRKISIPELRRGLARQYAVIGAANDFCVFVNDVEITGDERNLRQYLDIDMHNKQIVLDYNNIEIQHNTGWTISGWIGTLARNPMQSHNIKPGVIIMARGKMVQAPFLFNIESSHPTAFSSVSGEIHAEFVDAPDEDMIATSRTTLVWDTEPNKALESWGKAELYKIAREWAEKKGAANLEKIEKSPVYQKFLRESEGLDQPQLQLAKKLVQNMVKNNPERDPEELAQQVEYVTDFARFDAFMDIAQRIDQAEDTNVPELIRLFQEWEYVEAKEMLRVTRGRIETVEKLESLIKQNALEVPTLHKFLKEFPWVIDPRWSLVSDETTYSQLLRTQFPEPTELPEIDRRIDFLCVSEGDSLIVVEIKRPLVKASKLQLDQIEEYVLFMREHVEKTTDPDMRLRRVTGYLLVGDTVDTPQTRGRIKNLQAAGIYVRLYSDLLRMVKNLHGDFLERYEAIKTVRTRAPEILLPES
jgi:hypothetical protein